MLIIMDESQPQEGICVCDGGVIRKDYELMNMYRVPTIRAVGQERWVSSLLLSRHKLLHPLGSLP